MLEEANEDPVEALREARGLGPGVPSAGSVVQIREHHQEVPVDSRQIVIKVIQAMEVSPDGVHPKLYERGRDYVFSGTMVDYAAGRAGPADGPFDVGETFLREGWGVEVVPEPKAVESKSKPKKKAPIKKAAKRKSTRK